eukprot:CAMPEP_0176259732 /NCGR_PEP_ID=MMETSP0121_2-20121125/39221_1 /TAXON_ID=160619 /ORGANISM="Kryptoperidinium foliaceum, Strain CCMP 1326" /LENGTH=45 /DNA_ID= /DNA_START= /DNA_END= /DNA_ORIENTATION=
MAGEIPPVARGPRIRAAGRISRRAVGPNPAAFNANQVRADMPRRD